MGSLSLLQAIFPAQESNPGLLHCRWLLYQLSHKGSPEDIKERWQEYTEELYKKDLHDQDHHDGMIIHLEPDILECEVKWALESITMNKASGGDGIPDELFQILKDDAVKVLHSMPAHLENSAVATGLEKVIFIPIPEKCNGKECSNYRTITLISHASKVMLKILKARLQ